ncbi:hypothetical protein Tco_0205095 [Tanacetum coccineum]
MASYTRCEAGFFPFTYLGLPIGSNMSLEWCIFHNLNALWVHVVKAIHGDEAGIDIRGCHTNGVWASIVGRPVNVGRTEAEFDALISDIANLDPEELVDSDTCIRSLSHDDKFSVNSVRKHIDKLSLPSLSPCTWWCGVFGFSHATPQRKRRTVFKPSLLLPVEPYDGLEIISLSTLIL